MASNLTRKYKKKRKRKKSPTGNDPSGYPVATPSQIEQWANGMWVTTGDKPFTHGDRLGPVDVYQCYGLLSRLKYVWVSINPVYTHMHALNAPASCQVTTLAKFSESMVRPQLMRVENRTSGGNKSDDDITLVVLEPSTKLSYALPHGLDQCTPDGRVIVSDDGVRYVECPINHKKRQCKTFEMVAGDVWTILISRQAIQDDPSTLDFTDLDALANGTVTVDVESDSNQDAVVAQLVVTFDNVRSAWQMQRLAQQPTYRKTMTELLLDETVLRGAAVLAQLVLVYLENPFLALLR